MINATLSLWTQLLIHRLFIDDLQCFYHCAGQWGRHSRSVRGSNLEGDVTSTLAVASAPSTVLSPEWALNKHRIKWLTESLTFAKCQAKRNRLRLWESGVGGEKPMNGALESLKKTLERWYGSFEQWERLGQAENKRQSLLCRERNLSLGLE